MDSQQPSGQPSQVQPKPACPICGGTEITTERINHTFTYGTGESAVDLNVVIPVRHCDGCDSEYLDEEGERLKHDAVCRHLDVLPPTEIRRIRKSSGMSRARFAQFTGIGEASLNRWENGLNIQTHAYDRYLRLLERPETMRQLREILARQNRAKLALVPTENRFRHLKVTASLRTEQEGFKLRKVA